MKTEIKMSVVVRDLLDPGAAWGLRQDLADGESTKITRTSGRDKASRTQPSGSVEILSSKSGSDMS